MDFRASRRRAEHRHAAAQRARTRARRKRTAALVCAALGLVGTSAAVAHERATHALKTVETTTALSIGSTGQRVADLQAKVGAIADGIFGPKTRAAVRRYQRAHGLPATGVANEATLESLGLTAAARATTTAAAGAHDATLDRIAQCESGGNPAAIGGGGRYRGKYQFTRATWRAVGGSGDPAAAPEAEQDQRALILLQQRGSTPWPVCG